jgi:lipopolysaccharide export system protein LptA
MFGQPVYALRSDKEKPTTIDADRVDVDDKKGISTFTGNVVMTRGSIKMTADKIIVYRDPQRGVDRVHATGKLARYRQRPDKKPKDVIAEAESIVYDANKSVVVLNRRAQVYQGKDRFSGDRIVYDIKEDKVQAKSAPASEKGGKKKQRVRITLQPKKK